LLDCRIDIRIPDRRYGKHFLAASLLENAPAPAWAAQRSAGLDDAHPTRGSTPFIAAIEPRQPSFTLQMAYQHGEAYLIQLGLQKFLGSSDIAGRCTMLRWIRGPKARR
jgi:hypothetical protein